VASVFRLYPWKRDHLRALVLGAGPIGLLGAMMLVAHPIETVAYSREPADSDRARLVRSFGARYVSSRDTSLDELSHDPHFDVIFEAVGTARLAFDALHALAPNGVCVFSGLPGGHEPIEIDLDTLMKHGARRPRGAPRPAAAFRIKQVVAMAA
jgi:threonine dehydrogenase-like Zn-dependent dehydrogenase